MANRCTGCGHFVPNDCHTVFTPDSAFSSESMAYYCEPCFDDNRARYNRIVYGIVGTSDQPAATAPRGEGEDQ